MPKEVQGSLESSMYHIPLTSIVLTVSESLEDQVDPGDSLCPVEMPQGKSQDIPVPGDVSRGTGLLRERSKTQG